MDDIQLYASSVTAASGHGLDRVNGDNMNSKPLSTPLLSAGAADDSDTTMQSPKSGRRFCGASRPKGRPHCTFPGPGGDLH